MLGWKDENGRSLQGLQQTVISTTTAGSRYLDTKFLHGIIVQFTKIHEVYQTCTTHISTLLCLQFIFVHSYAYKTNRTDMDINL